MSNLEIPNNMKKVVSGSGMIIRLVGSTMEAAIDLSQSNDQIPWHPRT